MKGSFLFVRLVFWSISLIYQDSQIRKYLFWLIFRFCNGKHRIKNKIWCEYTNIEVNLQLPFNIIIKSLRYDISKLMIQKWRRNKVLIWENYWKTIEQQNEKPRNERYWHQWLKSNASKITVSYLKKIRSCDRS